MKKIGMIALLLLGGSLMAEPHIKQDEKELVRDGVPIVVNDRSIILDHGRIIYKTTVEKGKKALSRNKWGDFFFGLEFGRPARSNGGWSIWNFLEVYYFKNKRYLNALSEFWPENVSLTRMDSQTIADFSFRLDENGTDGKVSVRMIQFKSHPDWIFCRVKFDSAVHVPWRLNLNAFPGNSNLPKERERWVATKENQHNLSGGPLEMTPVSAGIIFYSKFVHEQYGNMIVLNPGEYAKINFPKGGASVTAQLFPKKGTTEFTFGLSYFSDRPVGDMLPRFLNENADNIAQFMQSIQWNPTLKPGDFEQAAAELSKSLQDLKALGSDTASLEKELAALRNDHAAALEKKDAVQAAAAMTRLNELKKLAAKSGLDSFK